MVPLSPRVLSARRIVDKAIAFVSWEVLSRISEVQQSHDMPDDPDVGDDVRQNYWF